MTRTAENLPDFKRQMDVAGKLDAVDPTVAKLIATSGLSDGDSSDDKVSVSRGQWPAASLKPSQTSMVLPKALGMALFMLKKGKVGGDLGALVSKDGHILDGHHRWAATILASGSKGKVGGYGANLPGKDLLRVLNVVSKGLFNVRNGKAGKGSLAQFTEGNVRSMLEDFAENGIGGQFPWSAEDVRGTLERSFGSVEAGIDQMAKNASLITTSVPGWAPDRKQMPVIEPEQVPSAAKALTRGEVDWNDPHRKEGSKTLTASDRKRLIRLASSMPKGSPERRAILAGLKSAAYPREGSVTISNLSPRGFRLYYRFTRSPHGLATDDVPRVGDQLRKSMHKFVGRLGAGIGIPLSIAGESHYVLLDVDTAKGSIVFKADAQVKNDSRKKLTQEMIEAAESDVFSRFGYEVLFM